MAHKADQLKEIGSSSSNFSAGNGDSTSASGGKTPQAVRSDVAKGPGERNPVPRDPKELSREEAYALGMMRETWCHVEGKKEQAWARANRRHFPKVNNMSTLFVEFKDEQEPRCEWKVHESINRKERRHFPNKGQLPVCSWAAI